jgi:DNA-binding MarR family transcriptional regulator
MVGAPGSGATRLARREVAMHTVFFGLKRAHHGALRIMRHALAQHGLTAARFDMLYAVRERAGLPQWELRRALGVSGATVSRMVTSLVDLGLLARKRTSEDLRVRLISLTKAGRKCIGKAIRRFMTWGAGQLAVDSALCPKRWHDAKRCAGVQRKLEGALDRIRHAYRDVANLYRPWSLEDDVDHENDPLLKDDRP